MNRAKRVRSKRCGSALLLVVFAVVVLTITGAGLLEVGLKSRVLAIRTAQKMAARCAADAGLTKAIYVINENLTRKVWSDDAPPAAINEALFNCDATFSYKVGMQSKNTCMVRSMGNSGPAMEQVYAVLRLKGLFEDAIFVKEQLILKSDTVVDGFNSLDASDTDVNAKIGTMSTAAGRIILNPNCTVKGEVVVGVDGDPATVIKDLGATTGERYAMEQEQEFPEVVPPPLPDKGGISLAGKTLTIGPASSGRYIGISVLQESLKVKSLVTTTAGILVVDGGDVVLHVTGDIWFGNSCEIVIRPGASLTIYADGNITFGNDGGVDNQTGIAGNFKLYGTGLPVQDWDLKAKSESFGAIYAPNADIIVRAKGDIGSSIVCNNFEFKSGGNFHYDKALADVSTADEGVQFVMKYWTED